MQGACTGGGDVCVFPPQSNIGFLMAMECSFNQVEVTSQKTVVCVNLDATSVSGICNADGMIELLIKGMGMLSDVQQIQCPTDDGPCEGMCKNSLL